MASRDDTRNNSTRPVFSYAGALSSSSPTARSESNQPRQQHQDSPQPAATNFSQNEKAKAKKKGQQGYKVKPRPSTLQFNLVDFVKKPEKGKKKPKGAAVVPARETAKARSALDPRLAVNRLDSTAPAVRRGKEREKPKKKRVTPLKKMILQEREKKRNGRLQDTTEATDLPVDPSTETVDPTYSTVDPTIRVKDRESDSQPYTKEDSNPKGVCEHSVTEENGSATEGGEQEEDLHPKGDAELSVTEENGSATQAVDQKETFHKKLQMSVEAAPFVPQGLSLPSTVEAKPQMQMIVPKVPTRRPHSRRFREYCNQLLSPELDKIVSQLLEKLWQFQKRQHQQNPVKARMRRRLVIGMKETTKYAVRGNLLAVVMAPDMEKVEGEGGLDDVIQNIKNACAESDTPICYALNRKKIGKLFTRKIPISVSGILSADGAYEELKAAVKLSKELRDAYNAQPPE